VIRIRPARETDAAYVAATALKQAGRFVRAVDREELALVVRAMLSSSRIVVACSETDEDTLLGWAAAIGGAPWFRFVARDARGNGIGARLRLEVVRGSDDPIGVRSSRGCEDAGNDSGARGAREPLGFWGARS
jgi:ribosomal protein S18 acetylase RimI-like enzyme